MTKECRTGALVFLALLVHSAEAKLNDPSICYILDAFLLLYCIVFTALYFKERFTRSQPSPPEESIYTPLNENKRNEEYETLELKDNPGGAAATGRNRKQQGADEHYMPLKERSKDEYQELKGKKGKKKMVSSQPLKDKTQV